MAIVDIRRCDEYCTRGKFPRTNKIWGGLKFADQLNDQNITLNGTSI